MNSYWDTSALIPCLIAEKSTEKVRAWLQAVAVSARFTSWYTLFEFEMVMNRKLARKLITPREYNAILEAWSDFQATLNFIPLDHRVARVGIRLQRLHGLLSGDGVQLGTACLVHLDDTELVFACLDEELNRVAKFEGIKLCGQSMVGRVQ